MFVTRVLVIVVLLGIPVLVGLSYYVQSRALIFLRRLVVRTVLFGLVAVVGLGSCDARYSDVSREQDYAKWIGQRCVVLKGLRAHGFTLERHRNGVTHEVDVTTLPGIGGSEITFTTPMPKGTTIEVKSVRRCWNCPFGRTSYGIDVPDIPELRLYKVFARPEALAPEEARCVANSH
jgi:hypothetical protein